MSNFARIPPNCSALPGNVSCLRLLPPKDDLSLLSLKTTLNPIITVVEFSALSVAFIGNVLIVLTIFSNKKMRSMAHLSLLNVAIADLFFSALNIAGHATEQILDDETLKKTFCTLYRPIIAKKIRKLLITLILSVVIFWSPYHCLFLFFVFGKTLSSPQAQLSSWSLRSELGMSGLTLTPF